YFDWAAYKRFAELPEPENPWTPAISVMQGLHAALELYFEDGIDAAMVRHRMLSRAVKEGAKALGLDLFGEGLDDNWTVTAIRARRPGSMLCAKTSRWTSARSSPNRTWPRR